MQQRCSMRMFPFWIPNQVWDDNYREPHLEEGALKIKRTYLKKIKPSHPTKLRMNPKSWFIRKPVG